jgi:hypothetical protein
MKLSENFWLSEMTKSQTAVRLGIDNTPNAQAVENLKTLATKVLQPVRDHFKQAVTVSSGYRAPKVNQAVGGSGTSDHTRGQAADIEIIGVSNYDLALWISQNLQYTQLILEFYTPGEPSSGWVHVSYDPQNLKKENLTAAKTASRTVYHRGLVA